MCDPGHHLPERSHLFRLHQLRLGLLEVHQRLAQHPVALGDARLHGLQQVEHGAQATVAALFVDQGEVLGDRILQATGDLLRRLFQAGAEGDAEGRPVHDVAHRMAAPEVAAETLHEDVWRV